MGSTVLLYLFFNLFSVLSTKKFQFYLNKLFSNKHQISTIFIKMLCAIGVLPDVPCNERTPPKYLGKIKLTDEIDLGNNFKKLL